MEKPQDVLARLQQLRAWDHRSQDDCAAALGISIEEYEQIEKGTKMLELSDLELLAFFFKLPITVFFEDDTFEISSFTVIKDQLQQHYRNLRRKLLAVTLLNELKKQDITLQDLHEKTQIPMEDLEAYTSGLSAIPLQHLFELSHTLSLSIQNLANLSEENQEDSNNETNPTEWELEYPHVRGEEVEEEGK